MSFSRKLQFINICEDILSDSAVNFGMYIKIIADYTEYTKAKAYFGYWNVTSGDLTFIRYMEMLSNVISNNCDKAASDTFICKLIQQAEVESESKLKIVFFAPHISSVWTSLEGIYHACTCDERFITQLVFVPGYHHSFDKSVDHFRVYKEQLCLPVLNYDEYNISDESPDVAFFTHPYDFVPYQYAITQVQRVISKCCLISYGIEATKGFCSSFLAPIFEKIWRYIVYGNELLKVGTEVSKTKGKNIVAWGHPRVDLYKNFNESKKNISVELKKKIAGRKTFLWCPHHSFADSSSIPKDADFGTYGTFFKWKDEIFDYFESNNDVFLIFRPHPVFRGMAINGGYMTELEYNEMENQLASQDNVFIDKSDLYIESFYASDAIITDGTSSSYEYLLTGNPLLLTYKQWYDNDTGEELDNIMFKDEYFENVDVALEKRDVTKFIEMVRNGEDYKRDKRKSFTERLFIINPEGNGEHIKNKIYEELLHDGCTPDCINKEYFEKRHTLLKMMHGGIG